MIVQVGANTRFVEHDRNRELRQLRGWTYSGKHHDVRRADSAGSKDHLAAASRITQLAVLPPAHAGRALAAQLQSFNKTAGFELKILPM